MRKSIVRALGAASVAAVGGALLLGAPAVASETPVDGYTFYDETDFGQEDGGYPTTDWFFGDTGPAAADPVFTADGLELTGKAQILRTHEADQTEITETEFTALVESIEVYGQGDWYLQVPLFFGPAASFDADKGFTTLRPASAATTATDGDWISTGAIGDIAKNTPVPFADIVSALFAEGSRVDLLAYGLFVDTGATATIGAVASSLDRYSIFTDDVANHPVQQVEPASATVTDFAETGVEFTATGLTAGEERAVFVFPADVEQDGEPLVFGGVVADDGTLTVQLQGDLAEGEYFAATVAESVGEGESMPLLDRIGYFVPSAAAFAITADATDGTEGGSDPEGETGAEGETGTDGVTGTDDDAATGGDDAGADAGTDDPAETETPAAPGDRLPDTGASVAPFLAAGLIVALAGAGLLYARRRSLTA